MISFPGLGKEELGEEKGRKGKGGEGATRSRSGIAERTSRTPLRERERRLVMNYAPRNARVKLRNYCPHEYTQGRGEKKDAKDGQLEDFSHLPASKMSRGKNATSHHQFITVPDSEMGRAPPQRNM